MLARGLGVRHIIGVDTAPERCKLAGAPTALSCMTALGWRCTSTCTGCSIAGSRAFVCAGCCISIPVVQMAGERTAGLPACWPPHACSAANASNSRGRLHHKPALCLHHKPAVMFTQLPGRCAPSDCPCMLVLQRRWAWWTCPCSQVLTPGSASSSCPMVAARFLSTAQARTHFRQLACVSRAPHRMVWAAALLQPTLDVCSVCVHCPRSMLSAGAALQLAAAGSDSATGVQERGLPGGWRSNARGNGAGVLPRPGCLQLGNDTQLHSAAAAAGGLQAVRLQLCCKLSLSRFSAEAQAPSCKPSWCTQ